MSTNASLDQVSREMDQSLAKLIEELTERMQAGEKLSHVEVAREHPNHAAQLEQLWPALQAMANLSSSVHDNAQDHGPTTDSTLEPCGTLGDYRILREIGRGGMGVVYEAEQVSLGRRVALKVLPFAATMDPRQLQRFQNEARAAASLDHPHVVKVHAVGCERGVYYYAMQFIDGQSLDAVLNDLRGEYRSASPSASPDAGKMDSSSSRDINKPRSTVVDRKASTSLGNGQDYFRRVAELMIQAAEAVDHAHHLGVVHRDIKPGNLMLDGRGNLWVTDFGLAQFQSDVKLTMSGDVVGTLRYMSPEQALGKRAIVDHRTDVYSLGATLYELLTFQPAFLGQDRQELLRQIALDEPKLMRHVNRTVPEDLETIVGKAMEKNPQDRYGSAKDFAEDLKRFLRHETTLARCPTILQKTRKWCRRHFVAVRAAAVLCVAVICVVAMSGWWLRVQALHSEAEMASERDKALAAEKLTSAALAETEEARKRIGEALKESEAARRTAEEVRRFLVKTLKAPNPEVDGRDVKVIQLLDQAAQVVENTLAKEPNIKAELMNALGETYFGLGEFAKALAILEKALSIRQTTLGQTHRLTINTTATLGIVHAANGTPERGIPLLEDVLKRCKNNSSAVPIDVVCVIGALADLYVADGRLDEAETFYERALELASESHEPEHANALKWMNSLAAIHTYTRNPHEAEPTVNRIYQRSRDKLGADHPDTLAAWNMVAENHLAANRAVQAKEILDTLIPKMENILGPNHPNTLTAVNNLYAAYLAIDGPAKAVPFLEQSYDDMRRILGQNSLECSCAAVQLAEGYKSAGKPQAAIALLEKTLTSQKAKLGENNISTIATGLVLAEVYFTSNRPEDAIKICKETQSRVESRLGDKNFFAVSSAAILGTRLFATDKLKEAIPYLQKAKKNLSPTAQVYPTIVQFLGLAYIEEKKTTEAEIELEEFLVSQTKTIGRDHPDTVETLLVLAKLNDDLKQFPRAIERTKEAFELSSIRPGPQDKRTLEIMGTLAYFYRKDKQFDASIALYEELVRVRLKADHPKLCGYMRALAFTFEDAKQPRKAIELLEEVLALQSSTLSPYHNDTLQTMKDLGLRLSVHGPAEKGIELYERVLLDIPTKIGIEHPLALAVPAGLYSLYWQTDQVDKYIDIWRTTLELRKAKLGENNKFTIGALQSLGSAYSNLQMYEKAIPLLKESVVLRAGTVGPGDATTQNAKASLAQAYRGNQQYSEAIAIYQEILAHKRKKAPNEYHGEMNHLAALFREVGKLDESYSMYVSIIKLLEAKDGPDHFRTRHTKLGLALTMVEMKKFAPAEEILRRTLDLLERDASNGVNTYVGRTYLGICLVRLKKFDEAESWLLRGYQALEKHKNVHEAAIRNTGMTDSVKWLVELYEAWGRPDEAAHWRTKLANGK